MIQSTFLVLLFLLCAGSGVIYLLLCAVTIKQPISCNIAYRGGIASVLALVLVKTLVLSAFNLIAASSLAPSTFSLMSYLALAPNFTDAPALSIPLASDLALASAAASWPWFW